YDEDYGFLRDPRCRTERWDALKYLGLSDTLPAHISLGVDLRERFEYFSTFDWGRDPTGEAGFLIQRLMPHADVRVGRRFQAFVQLTSNLVFGREPRPLDRDDLDL